MLMPLTRRGPASASSRPEGRAADRIGSRARGAAGAGRAVVPPLRWRFGSVCARTAVRAIDADVAPGRGGRHPARRSALMADSDSPERLPWSVAFTALVLESSRSVSCGGRDSRAFRLVRVLGRPARAATRSRWEWRARLRSFVLALPLLACGRLEHECRSLTTTANALS